MSKKNIEDINWVNATESDQELLKIIKFLLKRHTKLLQFLFNSKYPQLRAESEKLKREARCFSSGEYTLVTLALDLWDGSGDTKIRDIFNNLDRDLIKNAILVISKERGISL